MRTNLQRFSIVSFLITLLLLFGCSSEKITKNEEYQFIIGVSQSNVLEPWRAAVNAEITQSVHANKNVNVIFTDSNENSEKQIEDIDKLMAYGIDLLIVSSNNQEILKTKLVEVYKQIPIIMLGVPIEGDSYTTFIENDNELIGEMGANIASRLIGNKNGHVILIRGLASSPLTNIRTQAFQNAMQNYSNIDQVELLDGDWLRDKAEDRMIDYLILNKNVDVVFAYNDEMAYGAYIASIKLKIDGIQFIGTDGFGGEFGGANLVEKEVLSSTLYCGNLGQTAFDYALKILDNQKVPKRVVIKPKEFRKDTP